MASGSITTGCAKLGLVLLLLIAAVPQVVCSCGMSWGPAGMFGSVDLCPAASARAEQEICCCCKSDVEGSCDPSRIVGTDCECRFYFAPITGNGPAVPMPATGELVAERFVDAGDLSAIRTWSERVEWVRPDILCLTPMGRCALLQSWRA